MYRFAFIGEQTIGLRNGLLGTQGCYWGDPYESSSKIWVRELLPENVTLEACEEKCQAGAYPYFSLRTVSIQENKSIHYNVIHKYNNITGLFKKLYWN